MGVKTSPRPAPCGDVEYLARSLWRQLVRCVVCAGTASMIPPGELVAAADVMVPAPTWRRREVRAGMAAIDAYVTRAARIVDSE